MKIIDNNSFWDKPINISVTLKELQMLYDYVGIGSFSGLENQWRYYNTNVIMPYTVSESDALFEDLHNIIKEYGGII